MGVTFQAREPAEPQSSPHSVTNVDENRLIEIENKQREQLKEVIGEIKVIKEATNCKCSDCGPDRNISPLNVEIVHFRILQLSQIFKIPFNETVYYLAEKGIGDLYYKRPLCNYTATDIAFMWNYMKNVGKTPLDMGNKRLYIDHILITRDKHPEYHKICICDSCLAWDMFDREYLMYGPEEPTLRTLHGADESDDEYDSLTEVD